MLLGDLVLGVPTESWAGLEGAWISLGALAALSIVLLWALTRFARRIVATSYEPQTPVLLAVGALLAIVPVTLSHPTNRLLASAEVGMAGLLALALYAIFVAARERSQRWNPGTLVSALVLLPLVYA